MAKFRDSRLAVVEQTTVEGAMPTSSVHDRALGDILQQTKSLSTEQVEQILAFQSDKGLRFGEAAIALGFATDEDILFALSQQFHYHYAPAEQHHLSAELVVANRPFSRQAEGFRAIRSQLMMRVFGGEPSKMALAIVSPDAGDGKTYFSANLAIALSQLGGRTLLVDADLRGPRQQGLFGIESMSGLSSVLSGRAEANVIQQIPALPSLYLLPAGVLPPNPLELVERPAFGLLIRELKSKFDHVIVDTPAAAHGSDASVIASRCGAALVVARKGRSQLRSLQDLVGTLSDGAGHVAGVIMNEY
ncbi:polysaccharide biosynthesis tyrosine autokinase [Methylibium petroleiphilum]|uniref:polysaccharide biosynthesis tyrosine autokinase n=1 Tax=Methylibium petroleiphilum TaxID=105560 RepID=UPI001AC1F666|nr:polysaccharide biosynthesis tyrosine autokinase [Methylibium petroleiphilum]MBN9205445.1 polysaccharide biosynthesis tyrosine autokinase [Methylibium petroleiphilum]